jgi:collagenase-like PrtC family protease
MDRIGIALGPLLFNWSPEAVTEFYQRMAAAPVDDVYLGEVVCAKRKPLHDTALTAAAEGLVRAGKRVIRSTLALPASPAERRALDDQLCAADGLVEINDVAALSALAGRAPFIAGPLLNVYNEAAARELMARGCLRLCGNVELSLEAVAAIRGACPGLEVELFAYGRIPLALSARCYHARMHGRRKDTCQFVCARDPDGRAVATIEGERFLAVNGVQVMSHDLHLASVEPYRLRAAGVSALRLSPHTGDMAAVAGAFRDFLDERIDRRALAARVAAAGQPAPFVDGYLHGGAGRLRMTEP